MERNQPACGSGHVTTPDTKAAQQGVTGSGVVSGSTLGQADASRKGDGGGMQEAKDRAQHTTENVRHQVRETTDRLKEGWEQTREQTMQAASDAAHQMREQGSSLVNQQKDRAAEELSHFSAAIREASNKLHEENDHHVANYAEMVADQVDDISGYIRDRDLNRMMHDAADCARRRPELFFGGMFVLGLTAARFLKASSRSRRDRDLLPEPSQYTERHPGHSAQAVGVPSAGAFQTMPSSNVGSTSQGVDVGSVERIGGTQHGTAGNGPTGLGASASTERTSASGQSLSGTSGSPKVAGSSQPDVPPACATNPSGPSHS